MTKPKDEKSTEESTVTSIDESDDGLSSDSDAESTDEYGSKKKSLLNKINENNASLVLQNTTFALLNALRNLNIDDINEIEDLYLIVAQLTHAASFVIANKKSIEKNIPFIDALYSCDADDVSTLLYDLFKKEIHQGYCSKILEIDKRYLPGKQPWAGLHDKMSRIYGALQNDKVFNFSKKLLDTLDKIKIEEELIPFCTRIEYFAIEYLDDGDELMFMQKVNHETQNMLSLLKNQQPKFSFYKDNKQRKLIELIKELNTEMIQSGIHKT